MDDHQRLRHRENRCYPPFQGQQIWLEYDDLRAVNDPIRATVGDGDVVVDLSDAFSRLPMQAC